MDTFATILEERPLAVLFGAAGLGFQLIWPLFRGRRAILLAQFGIGAGYCLHYLLLGAWSGAAVTALGATQTVLALVAGGRPWAGHAGLGLLPLVVVVSALTWSGAASLFALCAVGLIMIGRMQTDTLRLRVFLLAASPFAIGHDLVVGAFPALLGALVSAAVAAVMLARELHERHRGPLALPHQA